MIEPRLPAPDEPQPHSSIGLARELIEAERRIAAESPLRVLVSDDSDAALAAALVAAKVPIEVAAADGALSSGSVNARLISRLIDA